MLHKLNSCSSFDFSCFRAQQVFIDGDHSYEAVREDLAAWEAKLVPGGIIAGHDFGNNEQVPTAIARVLGRSRYIMVYI